ncbi:MAPEG family protein [compost metagenome]
MLVAHATGLSNESTAMATALFFYSRIVHALAYAFALPWVRTLGFTGGWLAMVWLLFAMHGMHHAA